MTHQTSIVLDVQVEHEGDTHVASYFVEHGVVQARIGARVLLVPLLDGDADEMVKVLLREHLRQTSRMVHQAGVWQRV